VRDGDNSLLCIHSTLRPAFYAAFAGLGELLSWLWHPERDDLKVQNTYGNSLLDVAVVSRHGAAWVVAGALKGGCEINNVQKHLYPAFETGKFSIV